MAYMQVLPPHPAISIPELQVAVLSWKSSTAVACTILLWQYSMNVLYSSCEAIVCRQVWSSTIHSKVGIVYCRIDSESMVEKLAGVVVAVMVASL